MRMPGKRIFVTVGTTKFEKLIETIQNDKILMKLYDLGYRSIQFQTGTGKCKEKFHPKLKIYYQDYFEDFNKEIKKYDLIISHAGAGTCLDVLRCEKPLIVVINEDLMDNHQEELAEEMQKFGFLYYCTCDNLEETLNKDLGALRLYPDARSEMFSIYVDMCMGYDA